VPDCQIALQQALGSRSAFALYALQIAYAVLLAYASLIAHASFYRQGVVRC